MVPGLAEVLSGLHHLRNLCLERVACVTPAVLTTISQCCPNLSILNLRGCMGVGDEGLRILGEACQVLEEVDLSYTDVSSLHHP